VNWGTGGCDKTQANLVNIVNEQKNVIQVSEIPAFPFFGMYSHLQYKIIYQFATRNLTINKN
jgi:hypothetical protein